MALTCLIAFLSGFLYDGTWVAWTHCSEKELAAPAAALSLFAGATAYLGLSEALPNHAAAVCLIIGHGLGAYCTIVAKRWLRRRKMGRGA